MQLPRLGQSEIELIARALADTTFGFTGTELGMYIPQYGFKDTDPTITKHKRLYNAFCERVTREQNSDCIFIFLQNTLNPIRGLHNQELHEKRRFEVNKVLMFHGIELDENGKFHEVDRAKTVSEVVSRTQKLRQKLYDYDAHYYVLRCCKCELLQENYFHAVLEAAKGLCEIIRERTGLREDGSELIDKTFSKKDPYLALNTLQTETECSMQNGLKEMINGILHMVRNVTAHELKIRWDINEKDAIEILNIISLLHKYIEKCTVVPRYRS